MTTSATTDNDFALRLKEAMQKKSFKQVDLLNAAAESGKKLGKSQLSQYVSGKTIPRPDVADILANLLDVDADWLLSGIDSETKSINVPAQPNKELNSNAETTLTEPKTDNREGTPMRTFKKSSKLDNVLYDVRGPVVDEAARMEEAGTHVLKLNIGNPAPFGFRTPDEVVHDMRQQLTECEGYSDSKGLFSARKAIMQYAQLKKLPNVTMDGIYTGNGVSELINLCLSALLDSGDEILIPSPDYPLWTACATLAGGTPVHYICDEQ